MPTDARGHSAELSGIVIPEVNVRKWFQSLASGSDRCLAMAIADEVFNETFISLASSGLVKGNQRLRYRQDRRPDYSGITRSVNLEDIIQKYSQLLHEGVDSYQVTPENTALRIETGTHDSSPTLKSVHGTSGLNNHTEIRLTNGCAQSTTFSVTNPCALDKNSESSYATIQFKSGLTLPIRPKTIHLGEKSSAQQHWDSRDKNSSKDMVTVDDRVDFSLLNYTQRAKDSAEEKRRKAYTLIAQSKHAASSAVSSTSRRTNDEEAIIEHICLVFSSALSHVTDKGMDQTNSSPRIARITIDPVFLDLQEGNQNRFLYLVDKWIRSTLDQRHGPEKNDLVYFLNEEGAELSHNSSSWPYWLGHCMDPGHESVKLILVLLARMEMSIREAHRRYLIRCGWESHCKSTVSGNVNLADASEDQCRERENTFNNQNVMASLQPLVRSSNYDQEDRDHGLFSKILSLRRACQMKKTYSTILSDSSQTQSYGVLHAGLSPFKLEDVLLVPFSLISEYAISCGVEMEEKFNPDSFIKDLSKQWKNIFLYSVTCGVFERSSVDHHVARPVPELQNESVDVYHDDKYVEDESSQAHDDSKGKRKKKKKKKKKTNDQNHNDKYVVELNEGVTPDHYKNRSAETEENSTSAVEGISSKGSFTETNAKRSSLAVDSKRAEITVSKLSGSNSTCVVGLGRVEIEDDHDDDEWETVEHKSGRGAAKSKKDTSATQVVNGCTTNTITSDVPASSSIPSSPSGKLKSGKGKKRNSRRHNNKQITKELLNNLIQSTDDEVLGLKETKASSSDNDGKCAALVSESSVEISLVIAPSVTEDPGLGAMSNSRKKTSLPNSSSTTFAEIARLSLNASSLSQTKDRGSSRSSQQDIFRVSTGRESDKSKVQKFATASFADQNTAQTCPETVSGVSGTSGSTLTLAVNSFKHLEEGKVRGSVIPNVQSDVLGTYNTLRDESYDSTDEDERNSESCNGHSDEVPPLQTLLGPGVTNSATSSVASSLEVPHAIRRNWNSNANAGTEDDVGYHLLEVCERLSEEMNTFMTRRASALTHRRQERAALLAALQDIAQNIWCGSSCHVEMYGSCATQLDLPSSDLDVVVCGLDIDPDSGIIATRNGLKPPKTRQSRLAHAEDDPNSNSYKDLFTKNTPHTIHHPYPSLSSSGMRVLRLAADLERQPWAVQVKAIPTASVPVVKVLADPSRLSGLVSVDGAWLRHQENITTASAVSAGGMIPRHQQLYDHVNFLPGNEVFSSSYPPNGLQKVYQNSQPPWRGADVMNGLISVDITFEGPEHGGIGSTSFSARVVQEACNETGLPPDRTPAVQLIMVLKEMLAQRRLNEPFSGGLSSYAILLLAVAVIKERRAIREELERVEKQRRAVAMDCNGRQLSRGLENNITAKSDQPYGAHGCRSKHTPCLSHEDGTVIYPNFSNHVMDEKKSDDSSEEADRKFFTSTSKKTDENALCPDLTTPREGVAKIDTESIRSPLFPQGSNDVLEVLCSGEATAGKLLMHFLLFYGHHFDAQTTCIDVLGTHHPDYSKMQGLDYSAGPTYLHSRHLSPFLPRKAGGVYDPVTGIYTVDHIVVYDPLEGSENNNVARSCFAWSTIRWVFEQCYNTLSGLVERDNTVNSKIRGDLCSDSRINMHEVDDMPHLLELLLSF